MLMYHSRCVFVWGGAIMRATLILFLALSTVLVPALSQPVMSPIIIKLSNDEAVMKAVDTILVHQSAIVVD